jgi:hypothetical protein
VVAAMWSKYCPCGPIAMRSFFVLFPILNLLLLTVRSVGAAERALIKIFFAPRGIFLGIESRRNGSRRVAARRSARSDRCTGCARRRFAAGSMVAVTPLMGGRCSLSSQG